MEFFCLNKYQRKLQHLYSWNTSVVFASSVGFLSSANSTSDIESKQKNSNKRAVTGFWPNTVNKEFAKNINKRKCVWQCIFQWKSHKRKTKHSKKLIHLNCYFDRNNGPHKKTCILSLEETILSYSNIFPFVLSLFFFKTFQMEKLLAKRNKVQEGFCVCLLVRWLSQLETHSVSALQIPGCATHAEQPQKKQHKTPCHPSN